MHGTYASIVHVQYIYVLQPADSAICAYINYSARTIVSAIGLHVQWVASCNPNANWLLATYLTKSTKTKDSLPPMCHYIMPTVKSAREDVLYYTYCIFFFFGRSFNPNAQVTASFVSISVYCASCALYSSFFLSQKNSNK